jgi:hypothetical protein
LVSVAYPLSTEHYGERAENIIRKWTKRRKMIYKILPIKLKIEKKRTPLQNEIDILI